MEQVHLLEEGVATAVSDAKSTLRKVNEEIAERADKMCKKLKTETEEARDDIWYNHSILREGKAKIRRPKSGMYNESAGIIFQLKIVVLSLLSAYLYLTVIDTITETNLKKFAPCNDGPCHYMRWFASEYIPGTGVDFVSVRNGLLLPLSMDVSNFSIFTQESEGRDSIDWASSHLDILIGSSDGKDKDHGSIAGDDQSQPSINANEFEIHDRKLEVEKQSPKDTKDEKHSSKGRRLANRDTSNMRLFKEMAKEQNFIQEKLNTAEIFSYHALKFFQRTFTLPMVVLQSKFGKKTGLWNVPRARCDGESMESMQEKCVSALTDSTLSNNFQNHMAKGPSRMVLYISLLLWAAGKATHDLMLYHDADRYRTLMVSLVATVFQGIAAACFFVWAMGAAEVFYLPIEQGEPGCGCYYQLPHLETLAALSSPIVFLFGFAGKIFCLGRSILWGDFMHAIQYDVPYHFAAKSMGYTVGSLVTPAVTAHQNWKHDHKEEEHWHESFTLLQMKRLRLGLTLLGAWRVVVFFIFALCSTQFFVRLQEAIRDVVNDFSHSKNEHGPMGFLLFLPVVIAIVICILQASDFLQEDFSEDLDSIGAMDVVEDEGVKKCISAAAKSALVNFLAISGCICLCILICIGVFPEGVTVSRGIDWGHIGEERYLMLVEKWGAAGFLLFAWLSMYIVCIAYGVKDDTRIMKTLEETTLKDSSSSAHAAATSE